MALFLIILGAISVGYFYIGGIFFWVLLIVVPGFIWWVGTEDKRTIKNKQVYCLYCHYYSIHNQTCSNRHFSPVTVIKTPIRLEITQKNPALCTGKNLDNACPYFDSTPKNGGGYSAEV